MDEKNYSPIQEFDSTYSSDTIQKLKILYRIIPAEFKTFFAFYIKLSELRLILNEPHNTLAGTSTENFDVNTLLPLLDELIPFSTQKELEKIGQIKAFIGSFTQMKDMLEMFDLIKELYPEGFKDTDDITNLFSFFGKETL